MSSVFDMESLDEALEAELFDLDDEETNIPSDRTRLIDQINEFERTKDIRMNQFLDLIQHDADFISTLVDKNQSLNSLIGIFAHLHPQSLKIEDIQWCQRYFDARIVLKEGKELGFIRSLATMQSLRNELAEHKEKLKQDIKRVKKEIEELKKSSLELISKSLQTTKAVRREEVEKAKENQKELKDAVDLIERSSKDFEKIKGEMKTIKSKCERYLKLPPNYLDAKKNLEEKYEMNEKLALEIADQQLFEFSN